MTCWAYYPEKQGEEVPEEFHRHSIDVAEYLFNDMKCITASVIRKVSTMLGVSEGLVYDAVFLSGLLHDLGKTCSCYQEKPWEGFSGHWVLSAGIVYNIITNPFLKAPVDVEVLVHLFVYPILLHHYAKADLLRAGGRNNMDSVQVHGDCIKPIRDLSTYGLGRVKSPIGRAILNDLLADLSDGTLNVSPIPEAKLRELLLSKLPDVKKYVTMAITGLLNEADGSVAGKNRNKRGNEKVARSAQC
jgi:CRISPR/Cas system-associated endonuclease Cas3-HD